MCLCGRKIIVTRANILWASSKQANYAIRNSGETEEVTFQYPTKDLDLPFEFFCLIWFDYLQWKWEAIMEPCLQPSRSYQSHFFLQRQSQRVPRVRGGGRRVGWEDPRRLGLSWGGNRARLHVRGQQQPRNQSPWPCRGRRHGGQWLPGRQIGRKDEGHAETDKLRYFRKTAY